MKEVKYVFILVLNKELCKTVKASNDGQIHSECVQCEIPATFWGLNTYC